MSKSLVSKAEFARMAHVSPVAIRKAIKHGRLKVAGEGRCAKIDLSDDLTKSYLSTENDQRKLRKNGPQKPKDTQENKNKSEQQELPLDFDSITFDDLKSYDKVTIDKWHVLEKVKAAKQERERKRGELIERKIVQTVLGKMFTIEKNEFLTFGDRLTPEISAIAGLNDPAIMLKINELIEKEAYKTLKHIQRVIDDFIIDRSQLLVDGEQEKTD